MHPTLTMAGHLLLKASRTSNPMFYKEQHCEGKGVSWLVFLRECQEV